MLEGVMLGLETAFSLQNLVLVVAGCLIGTIIGMLPGLGPMAIIAIMIPVAINIGDPSSALILLAGVYYGAIFGEQNLVQEALGIFLRPLPWFMS